VFNFIGDTGITSWLNVDWQGKTEELGVKLKK
jgi:hypothetical protein